MSEWTPIDSAPRDGTPIDVWVRNFSVGEAGAISFEEVGRKTDVRWGEEVYYYGGKNGTKRVDGERWVYWDGPHKACVESGGYRATHWMPVPTPPAGSVQE